MGSWINVLLSGMVLANGFAPRTIAVIMPVRAMAFPLRSFLFTRDARSSKMDVRSMRCSVDRGDFR